MVEKFCHAVKHRIKGEFCQIMTRLVLEMPNESLLPFEGSEERTGEELRMAAAAKLYEMRRLSAGAAARLAGVPRTVFLSRLSEYGVHTFNFGEDEFEKETRLA